MAFGKSATATLGSGAGYVDSGTTSPKSKFSQVLTMGYGGGGFDAVWRINNDNGSVYAQKRSQNHGGYGNSNSQSGAGASGGALNWDSFGVHYVFAVSGREKLIISTINSGEGSSYNWCFDMGWKYVPSDLTDTIDTFRMQDGFTNNPSGSDIATNSNVSIFGSDHSVIQESLTTDNLEDNTIYLETDTAKYKWWDGSEWKMDGTEAKVFRGIFAGGYDESSNASNVIDYITIPSTGNATDFGDLSVTRAWAGGGSNGTRGVFMGGRASSYLNTIDYVTITTPSNATDFGDLNNNMGYSNETACSDTRVVQAGGLDDGDYSNVMDYVTTATTGNATDFGDINGSAGGYGFCGLSNGTKGYFAGCRISGGMNPSFFHITIATTGNAVDTNYDLQHSNMWAGSGASEQGGSRGLIFAGYRHTGTNASINDIQYISLPISAHASDFGDLSASTESGMAVAGDGRAVYAHKGLTSDISQYVTIATTGNAVNFGTLTEARSHGGSTEGY